MTDHKAEWVLTLKKRRDAMRIAQHGAGMCGDSGCAQTAKAEADALDAAIAALTAAPAASEGEDGAVAWAQFEEGALVALSFQQTSLNGCDTPLYTRPAAQVAATPKHDEGRIEAAVRLFVDRGWCDEFGTPHQDLRELLRQVLATQPAARRVTDGVALIAAERQRQVDVEGWTPEHDDVHDDRAMAAAAACYARFASLSDVRRNSPGTTERVMEEWPWDARWWKPGDRIRDLTKAGALIAAEIDRLKRAESFAQPAEGVSK